MVHAIMLGLLLAVRYGPFVVCDMAAGLIIGCRSDAPFLPRPSSNCSYFFRDHNIRSKEIFFNENVINQSEVQTSKFDLVHESL